MQKKKVAIYTVLDTAYQCLTSDYLSVRVHGVKQIENYCSRIFKARLTEIKKDEMGEWLSDHNIIS